MSRFTHQSPSSTPQSKGFAMSHLLYKIGNFSGRHPWRVISAWLVIAGAVFMLNGSIGGAPDESFSLPGAESQRAADAIQDRFPQETLYSSNVVFHSEDGLTAPETKQAVEQAVTELAAGPHVIARQQSLRPARPDRQQGRSDRLRHGRLRHREGRARPTSTPPRRPSRTFATPASRSSTTAASATRTRAAGGNSELIGILMAVLILAIAFGSLVAMSLPIADGPVRPS